jgi:HisJ family histidinol phosphate phosphatase
MTAPSGAGRMRHEKDRPTVGKIRLASSWAEKEQKKFIFPSVCSVCSVVKNITFLRSDYMRKVDYHIHTVYSGHSDPDMTVENIITKAEELELDEIAITEHSFEWHLGPKGNLKLIRDEVAACETRVNVLVGMEVDPDFKNPGKLIFEDFGDNAPSPLLVGTHGFPGLERGWFEKFEITDSEKRMVYSNWFSMMEKVIARGIVDVLAHPGRIIMQNGILEEFDSAVLADFENLFATMLSTGTAFELNEKLLNYFPTEKLRRTYPDLIALAKETGLRFSIGSDAHSLNKIGRFQRVSGNQ